MRLLGCFCSSALLASLWFGCGSGGDEGETRAKGGSSATATGGSAAQSAGAAGRGGSLASGGGSASGGSSGSAGTAGTASGGSSGTAAVGGSAGSTGGGSGSGSEDASLPDVVFTYDAVGPEAEACATTSVQAELIPLDMYVMLDVSASMLDPTQSAGTKWDATKQAFIAFAQDPKSDGLGVGIQYFSLLAQGVPAQCSNQSQCGSGGPCVLRACQNNINAICVNNADCFPLSCVARGYCSNNANIHCIPVGGTACGAGNQCLQLTNSSCYLQDSCVAADYAKAAVAIAPLPGNRSALVSSINAQAPWSATPTSAALQGAIDHARGWATSHPTHRVVVLLATDGLPTRCDSNIANIAQIAASGANGSPKVSTYVLGVFSPAEAAQAQQNLDQIAASGGSGTAFVVGTSGNVSQALIDALNKIRGAALSCEYLMPKADGGVIDPKDVKIIFEDGSGMKQELGRVSDAGACGANGGFYYDNATTPTKILLCADTCTAAQNVSGAKVSIELGCLGS